MPSTPCPVRQAAAIPIRSGQVCMVLSSNGKRWVVPKGCIEPGQTAGEAAVQEAWEEAGLVGVLQPEPLGAYVYEKSGNRYRVTVFVMHVTAVADDWPERGWRTRLWSPPGPALARIQEPGLRELIRKALAPGAAVLPAGQRRDGSDGLTPASSSRDRG